MAMPGYSYHQPGKEKKESDECCSLSCLKFFLYMYNTVLGCCGISREGKALMLAYSALLALTIMVQVAVGITAYITGPRCIRSWWSASTPPPPRSMPWWSPT